MKLLGRQYDNYLLNNNQSYIIYLITKISDVLANPILS
jgi:hypothetical protein